MKNILHALLGVALLGTLPPISSAQSADHSDTVAPGPEWYATLDAMYYRYDDDINGEISKDWNLNGIRETTVGVRNRESADSPVIFNYSISFGADRAPEGRQYEATAGLLYFGAKGRWGQVTIGRQDNVMTNIAWSVLNPIAGGWGGYFSDLLYAGEPFTYNNRDATEVLNAGSNFFFGYTQTGVIYRLEGENFTFEADVMPIEAHSGSQSSTYGAGGTYTFGDLLLAGAYAEQAARNDATKRRNKAYGLVYSVTDQIALHLARMHSDTSLGSAYEITYGGGSWRIGDNLHLSAAVADYQQNAAAATGAGKSLGWSLVGEYDLSDKLSVYAAWDTRLIEGGEDGQQVATTSSTRISSAMVGVYYNFIHR